MWPPIPVCLVCVTGHKFKPMHDFGYVALDILYTYPEDSGTYTVQAHNKHGSDTTQATVFCKGNSAYQPPGILGAIPRETPTITVEFCLKYCKICKRG